MAEAMRQAAAEQLTDTKYQLQEVKSKHDHLQATTRLKVDSEEHSRVVIEHKTWVYMLLLAMGVNWNTTLMLQLVNTKELLIHVVNIKLVTTFTWKLAIVHDTNPNNQLPAIEWF